MLVAYFTDGWEAIPMAFVAWGTILLAFTTWLAIDSSNKMETQRIKANLEKEKRDRKECLLNEIIDWATDLSKTACIPHIIDPESMERMKSADRYFTLIYNGKKFLIAVEKQSLNGDLQKKISETIKYLDDNWNDFANSAAKRNEISKKCDENGKDIIEKAVVLLINS